MTDQNNTPHDLGTSRGARAYIAEYFASQIRRHDFAQYINSTLAADFACALAQHLSKLRAESDDYRDVMDEALVIRHLGASTGNAGEDLKKVLDWGVSVALEPAVPSEAQRLIDEGRASAHERTAFGRAEISFPMTILAGCHSVYLLPGWEKSKGASLEVAIARALGLPLFTVEGSPIQAGASVAEIRGELNGLGMMAHTALNQDANDRYNILDYLAERLLAMAGGVPMPNAPGHKPAPMYTSPGHSAPQYIADGKVGRLLDAAHAAVEILDDLSDHAAAQIASIELSNAAAAIAATERPSSVISEVMRHKNGVEKVQHERTGAA